MFGTVVVVFSALHAHATLRRQAGGGELGGHLKFSFRVWGTCA